MRTRGATTIPTIADTRRTTSQAFTGNPSLSKSRNLRPGAENESQPEQDEDRPPGPDVHVREDEFSEGRRVDEPVHERPGEEETRIRDLSFRPGRPSPWAGETLNDDRTEDHEEEEV